MSRDFHGSLLSRGVLWDCIHSFGLTLEFNGGKLSLIMNPELWSKIGETDNLFVMSIHENGEVLPRRLLMGISVLLDAELDDSTILILDHKHQTVHRAVNVGKITVFEKATRRIKSSS
jgi:hypothetical protein